MISRKWPDFAGEFAQAATKAGYVGLNKEGGKMNELTEEEKKVVRKALRSVADLWKQYIRPEMAKAYATEKGYARKAKRIQVALPLLRSALKKLK